MTFPPTILEIKKNVIVISSNYYIQTDKQTMTNIIII